MKRLKSTLAREQARKSFTRRSSIAFCSGLCTNRPWPAAVSGTARPANSGSTNDFILIIDRPRSRNNIRRLFAGRRLDDPCRLLRRLGLAILCHARSACASDRRWAGGNCLLPHCRIPLTFTDATENAFMAVSRAENPTPRQNARRNRMSLPETLDGAGRRCMTLLIIDERLHKTVFQPT
jgi:hypothetical protein